MPDKNSKESLSESSDNPEKRANRLERTIEDSVADLERTANDISTQIGNKEEALRKELNEANTALSALRQGLDQNAAELQKRVKISVNWIRHRVKNLEIASYLVALGFGTVYLLAIRLLNMPIEWQTFSPVIVAVALSVLVGYSARSAKNNLFDDTYTINQYLSETSSKISTLAGRKLKAHEAFEGIEQGLRSATSLTKRLLTATREFNPALKTVYDQATFRFRLNSFVHTLLNAFRFYGLDVDSETQKWLSSFESLSDSEPEWISDASKQLAKKLATSPLIISLFYYSYVDNTEGTRNTWQKMRASKEELASLSEIMIKNLTGSYIDSSNPKLVEVSVRILQSLETFEPKRLDEGLRTFYVDIQSLRGSIEQALTRFGFNLNSSQRRVIDEFIPSDADPENWRAELLETVGRFFHLNKDLIAVFVYENAGDQGSVQKTLARIGSDPNETGELLSILISNQIVKIPDRYADSTAAVLEVVSHYIQQKHFLSIEQIRDELKLYFSELDASKERLSQVLATYNVKMPADFRKRFDTEYVPPELSIPDMLDFLSENLGIRREFLALFYCEFTQDSQKLQTTFSSIKDHNQTKDLANLLVKLGFIESSGDASATESDNLASVLLSFDSFNLFSIQSRYHQFRNLLIWSKNLAAFCAEQELAAKGFVLDLSWLLRLLKNNRSTRSYEQLLIVCKEILSRSELRPKTDKTIHATALAVLVLFFKSQEDTRLIEASKEAASNDLASNLLYHFIASSEEAQLKRTKVTLMQIVQDVLSGKTIDYSYIDDTRSAISEGRIPARISDVASVRFERHLLEIKDIERKNAEVSQMFGELQTSLRQFFESKLDKDAILQLLKMQVISAYLITTPSKGPVIGEILEKWMPDVCNEFAKADSSFDGILLMERGTGRYTRIGIVPVGVSFEEFSMKFSNIFHAAVARYCTQTGEKPVDFSAYVIRIFPTETTFKMVPGDPTISTYAEHPALAIRELFLTRLSSQTNLALVAAARSGDAEKIAMKNVIVQLFDGYTSLWSLLENRIVPIIGTRKQLQDAFENRSFDKDLLARLQCKTITELAQSIYQLSSTQKGREETRQSIVDNVSQILKGLHTKMNDHERGELTNAIFDRLHNIGLILSAR